MKGIGAVGTAFLAAAAAAALAGTPAAAAEIDELKAQIEALQKRLGEIEARQKEMGAKQAPAAKAVMGGAKPGSWRMPGSDTSVSFSGYVKADAYYDTGKQDGETFSAASIPLDDQQADIDDGRFGLGARQSRIRFDTDTPTGWGGLSTRIETDFYGSGKVLRLRHAYASLGGGLAGQTWSILGDADTYADTIDFDGPAGVVSARVSQLRYSAPLGDGLTGEVAVEDNVHSSLKRTPTFLGALRYRAGWGAINASGAVAQVSRDLGAVEDDELAHALHFGANARLTDDTRVWATLNSLTGMQWYMLGGGAGSVLDGDGRTSLVETVGGFAGVTHRWTDTLRSGLYYGWLENEVDDDVPVSNASSLNKSVRTVHANLIWSPVPRVNLGVEFMHGWRESNPRHSAASCPSSSDCASDPALSTEGDASRIQVGLQYSF